MPAWVAEPAHRGIADTETVATLILINRLARGSISDDLRGIGLHHPHNLRDEQTVKEMIA